MFKDTYRADWGEYFLGIAEAVSSRASCYRNKVGCVLVRERHILSTGYNGAPHGRQNCLEKGECYRNTNGMKHGENPELCYSSGAFAEINAIVNAAKHGVIIEGSIMYLVGTDSVRPDCQSVILNAGIHKVIIKKKDGTKVFLYPKDEFGEHPLLDDTL